MKPNDKLLLKLAGVLSWTIALVSLVVGLTLYVLLFQPQWPQSLFTAAVVPTKPAVRKPTAPRPATDYFQASRYNLDSLKDDAEGRAIRYGHALISQTYQYVGPEVKNRAMRYAGSNLACQNCHLQAGQKRFSAPYVGIWGIYPAYKGREDALSTLEERINGCMERSLAGKALPLDSKEMKAMVTYIKWLGRKVPVGDKVKGQGFVQITLPNRAADQAHGKAVYTQRCVSCHGAQGQGQRKGTVGSATGYTYPPLWGPDSYNDGAGMHRVMTAARFIKANMPFGATAEKPVLSDEEAYDVAAYINSLPRPRKAHTEKDYPDLSKKPVDCPYPPYADAFPRQQHQFGPFAPMEKDRKPAKSE